MILRPLLSLLAVTCACQAVAAEPPAAKAKAIDPMGTVSGSNGTYVVVALSKGATVKVGDRLAVRRASLLVSLATPEGTVSRWGGWQPAGQLVVRRLQGTRYAVAFLVKEAPRPGGSTHSAPCIRPGDFVTRLATPPAKP